MNTRKDIDEQTQTKETKETTETAETTQTAQPEDLSATDLAEVAGGASHAGKSINVDKALTRGVQVVGIASGLTGIAAGIYNMVQQSKKKQ
jgi:hypothetical protein